MCLLFLGVLNTLYRPTLKAILPNIVNKKYLIKANSYRSMAQQIMEMVGPILAAYLVATFGIFITFEINGLSFLLAAFAFAFIFIDKNRYQKNMVQQFKEGFQVLFNHIWLGLSILIGSIVNIGIASFDVIILPIYANEYFKGIESFGWLLSSMALGAFLGAWIISRQSQVSKSFKKYYIFMFSVGRLVLCLSFSNLFLISLIIMFCIGFSITSFVIIWDSTVQELIEEEFLGRVTSLQIFGGLLFLPLGYYIFGLLIDHINIQIAIALNGIIIMLSPTVGVLNNRFNRTPAQNIIDFKYCRKAIISL
ncbi:MFS transporter [Virgibacillus pantothenticus]|uniref:MFS transporter n=1 Tax=Virgibacillus pantothenticus TaxID=1473 RepID=UPI0022A9BD8B|nr:MFS transporter [Virgibacillus pantothenticus]MED3737883.1 MFS transporter [Virgibacillus pantothenticus]